MSNLDLITFFTGLAAVAGAGLVVLAWALDLGRRAPIPPRTERTERTERTRYL